MRGSDPRTLRHKTSYLHFIENFDLSRQLYCTYFVKCIIPDKSLRFPGFLRTSPGWPLRFPTATPACPRWVFPAKSEKVKMRNEPNPTQENYQRCYRRGFQRHFQRGPQAVDPPWQAAEKRPGRHRTLSDKDNAVRKQGGRICIIRVHPFLSVAKLPFSAPCQGKSQNITKHPRPLHRATAKEGNLRGRFGRVTIPEYPQSRAQWEVCAFGETHRSHQ
jgi:hypothetical protein